MPHGIKACLLLAMAGGALAFTSNTPLRCLPVNVADSASDAAWARRQQPQRAHGLFFSKPRSNTRAPRIARGLPRSSDSRRGFLLAAESSNDGGGGDKLFDIKTTVALVGGQSLLIGAAALAARVVGTPNYGLGPFVDASLPAILKGILWSLPLGFLAVALDLVEDRFPALQEVTKATQSSVLSLLGGTFKPVVGVLTALALGAAAGLGEEMLFRGVLQFELGARTGSEILAVAITSIVFGALHAVTPLYAGLAALASVYFGWLYLATGNLVVPIITHAFYDWAALLYAHWTVANMSDSEQRSLMEWRFGSESGDE